MYRIILASESPRRKEIMKQMGIPYESLSSNIKEEVELDNSWDMVESLASLKAKDVAQGFKDQEGNVIIIGADTMVFHNGQALGKPKDRENAIRMLKLISGDVHEVYTGVSIIIKRNPQELYHNKPEEELVFSVGTQVKVLPLTLEQIEAYVDSGETMDKAGAYAIQGGFGIYIEEIHGDYYNVVGFPISKIYENLLSIGINIKKLK